MEKKEPNKMALLPFDMHHLTDDMVERAETELGETDEIRKEALIQMRKFVKEDPKLICPTDDNYLLPFLRARKFNLKRANGLLQNHYQIKKSYTDVYGKPNLDGLRRNITDKIINILPYRDYDGAMLMLIQLHNWNVEEMKLATFMHAITFSLSACVDTYPATQVCGIKVIVDTRGMGLRYAWQFSPRMLHLMAKGFTNCMPLRFKAIHFVNQSYVIQYCWTFMRMILPEKIKNRMHFHAPNPESLHKYISPELLPEEYGGTLDYDNSFWIKKIEEFESRYFQIMKSGLMSSKNSREEE